MTPADEAAFWAAIAAAPDDDLPKLVFADWLDERQDVRAAGLRWLVARGVWPAHDAAENTWDWWSRPPREPDYYPDRAWTAVLPGHLFRRPKGRPKDIWKGYKSYGDAVADLLAAWARCVADGGDPLGD